MFAALQRQALGAKQTTDQSLSQLRNKAEIRRPKKELKRTTEERDLVAQASNKMYGIL